MKKYPAKKIIPRLAQPALRLEDFPGFSQKNLYDLEKYYQTQLRQYRLPEKRVGWKTMESQKVRFEALTG